MQPPGIFGFWRMQSLDLMSSGESNRWNKSSLACASAGNKSPRGMQSLDLMSSGDQNRWNNSSLAHSLEARGIFPRSYTHRPNSWIGSGRGGSGAYLFLKFRDFSGVFFQIALTGLNRYLSNLSHKIDFFEVIYEYSIYIRIYIRCPKGVRGKNQQVHKCRIG